MKNNEKENSTQGSDLGLSFENKVYFYSDPHYGHNNVIKYCNRPFVDTKEMSRVMIENYNKVVPKDGITVWLGDCFFCSKEEAKKILDQLNGKKILICGNHDKNPFQMMKLGFDWACYGMKMNIEGKSVILSHYPWKDHYEEDFKYLERCPIQSKEDEWLIHGHVHQAWKVLGTMINTGIDVWDYSPIPLNEIKKIINKGPQYSASEV